MTRTEEAEAIVAQEDAATRHRYMAATRDACCFEPVIEWQQSSSHYYARARRIMGLEAAE
jgi:hypothetical protein